MSHWREGRYRPAKTAGERAQLIKRRHEHPDALRLCMRLKRYRAELTCFLWDEKLEGTNNAVERALRPAVVMRKITGGSRAETSAQAWANLASLVRTADQRGLNNSAINRK